MAQKILLLVAMPEELALAPRKDMILMHTGVGKVNAAWRTAQGLARHSPDMVINFGTAGALRSDLTGLVEVGSAMQRDMDLRALGMPLGQTPFEDDSQIIQFSDAPISCATGDSFVAAAPELPSDLVDMELYAIAKICRASGVALKCFKYVSDQANGAAPQDWRASLAHAASAFQARINGGIEQPRSSSL
jgi:adenosylhomocysteine nucleosidase